MAFLCTEMVAVPYPNWIDYLRQGNRQLAGRLEPRIARDLAARIVKQAAETRDGSRLRQLADVAMVLANHLDRKEAGTCASALLARAVRLASGTQKAADQTELLAHFSRLGELLDREQATALVESIETAILEMPPITAWVSATFGTKLAAARAAELETLRATQEIAYRGSYNQEEQFRALHARLSARAVPLDKGHAYHLATQLLRYMPWYLEEKPLSELADLFNLLSSQADLTLRGKLVSALADQMVRHAGGYTARALPDGRTRRKLSETLRKLVARLDASGAFELAERIVQRASASGEYPPGAMVDFVPVLASKLDRDRARPLARRISQESARTRNRGCLLLMTRMLAALTGRLDRGETHLFASGLAARLRVSPTDWLKGFDLYLFARSLLLLKPLISRSEMKEIAEGLAAGIAREVARRGDYDFYWLAAALLTLSGEIDRDREARLLADTATAAVELMEKSTSSGGYSDRGPSRALADMADRLDRQLASELAPRLVQLAIRRTDYGFLRSLSEALARMARKLEPARVGDLVPPLALHVVRQAARLHDQDQLPQGFTSLVQPLDRGQANELASKVATMLNDERSERGRVPLSRGLAALASKLDGNQALTIVLRIVADATRRNDPTALRSLADALPALSARMDAGQANRFIADLTARMAQMAGKSKHFLELGKVLDATIDGTGRVDQPLAGRLAASLAAEVVRMGARTPDVFTPYTLSRAFKALAARLDSTQASTLAEQTVDAAARVRDRNALYTLSQNLAAVAGKTDRNTAVRLAPRLVALAATTSDPYILWSLTEGLAPLLAHLDRGQARELATSLMTRLAPNLAPSFRQVYYHDIGSRDRDSRRRRAACSALPARCGRARPRRGRQGVWPASRNPFPQRLASGRTSPVSRSEVNSLVETKIEGFFALAHGGTPVCCPLARRQPCRQTSASVHYPRAWYGGSVLT